MKKLLDLFLYNEEKKLGIETIRLITTKEWIDEVTKQAQQSIVPEESPSEVRERPAEGPPVIPKVVAPSSVTPAPRLDPRRRASQDFPWKEEDYLPYPPQHHQSSSGGVMNFSNVEKVFIGALSSALLLIWAYTNFLVDVHPTRARLHESYDQLEMKKEDTKQIEIQEKAAIARLKITNGSGSSAAKKADSRGVSFSSGTASPARARSTSLREISMQTGGSYTLGPATNATLSQPNASAEVTLNGEITDFKGPFMLQYSEGGALMTVMTPGHALEGKQLTYGEVMSFMSRIPKGSTIRMYTNGNGASNNPATLILE